MSVRPNVTAAAPALRPRRAPCCCRRRRPRPSAARILVDRARRRDLRELAVELRLLAGGEVLERTGARQLVDRRRARLQLLGLLLRALDRLARVLHAAADSGGGLPDLHLGLGCRVLRFQNFLLRAEPLDARLERLLPCDEVVLLGLELLDLVVEPLELQLRRGLLLERLACEILAVGGERLSRLGLELDDVLLDLLRLDLEPFLRRDDIGDAALDVLGLRLHLLVGVIERLGRVLRPVEQLRELRSHDQRRA
jgi:hypothetical protein